MKNALLVLLALVVTAAHADPPNTYGKTDAQILKMGQVKWMDFTSGKPGGSSTAGMVEAEEAYRLAALRRNDKRIKTLPAVQASSMRTLRKLLTDYSDHCMTIGYFVSGGGTMWALFDAGGKADVEDVLYAMLGGPVKAAPATVVSIITKEFKHAKDQIASHDGEGSSYKRDDVFKALKVCQDDFTQITKLCAKLSRPKSDAVLAFCHQQIKSGADGN